MLKLLYSVPPHFQKMVMIRATCIIFRKKKDRFAALHSMLIQHMCRSVLPTVLPDDEISKAKQRKSEDFQEILGSRSALLDQASDAVLQSIAKYCITYLWYCKVLSPTQDAEEARRKFYVSLSAPALSRPSVSTCED